MDVVPAGMRSEATSRYIVDVVNTRDEVRVQYAFPNRLGAHVRYAGRYYGAATHAEAERWDVTPVPFDDPITMRRYVPEHMRWLTTQEAEMTLLMIRNVGRKR